jgi:ATP-dependent DNA helicase RecG
MDNKTGNPWLDKFGWFKEDPTFDDLQDEIASYRREIDQEMEEGKIRYDELINMKFDYETHFDRKKLDRLLRLAGITKVLDDHEILINLGAAEKQEGKIIFNNTGILFFAKNLEDIYFHTAVTCALYKGTEKVEVLDRRDFNEDIIGNINGAMNFLKQYIPVRYEMTGEPRRKEIPEIPYEALREAVINAFTHRDYFEKGSNVMVEIFDDRIEITNFGGLVKGLKPEDFGKRSVLRNPNIANLLHRIGYIEKMGTGINKMKKIVKDAGLPPIQFEFTTFFTAVFKRALANKKEIKWTADRIRSGVNGGAYGGVNGGVTGKIFAGSSQTEIERLMKIMVLLNEKEKQNTSQLADLFHIAKRTLERDLAVLKKKRLIHFTGAPRTGGYVLTKKGKGLIENFVE